MSRPNLSKLTYSSRRFNVSDRRNYTVNTSEKGSITSFVVHSIIDNPLSDQSEKLLIIGLNQYDEPKQAWTNKPHSMFPIKTTQVKTLDKIEMLILECKPMKIWSNGALFLNAEFCSKLPKTTEISVYEGNLLTLLDKLKQENEFVEEPKKVCLSFKQAKQLMGNNLTLQEFKQIYN